MTDSDRAVSTAKAAPILGVEAKTLANWRSAAKGPPYYRIGRTISYPLGKLIAWRDAHLVTPKGGTQ